MNSPAERYELVFEGAAGGSDAELRRLRTALVAELNFSAEEARKILAGAQVVLQKGETAEELNPTRTILERAGAKVSVKSAGEAGAPAVPLAAQSLIIADAEEEVHTPEESDSEDTALSTEATPLVDSDHLNFLDPVEQVSDLLRDLEEACVLEHGQEVLRALPIAGQRKLTDVELNASDRRPLIERIVQSRVWHRAVSWPEMLFAVGFSLLIVIVGCVMVSI